MDTVVTLPTQYVYTKSPVSDWILPSKIAAKIGEIG